MNTKNILILPFGYGKQESLKKGLYPVSRVLASRMCSAYLKMLIPATAQLQCSLVLLLLLSLTPLGTWREPLSAYSPAMGQALPSGSSLA